MAMNGNHKWIQWKFVVHGAVDGFSRLIVFLKYSTNNRVEAILQVFLTPTLIYGLPQKLSTDMGGENVDAWHYMMQQNGNERCVIVGSSVHNKHIERLWQDIHRAVCRNVRNCSSGLRGRGSWMSTMILICFVCIKFSHATLTHVCLGSWEAGTATTSTEHSINATVRLASISCTDHKISRILSIWHFIRADQFRNGSAVGNWVVTYRHFGTSWAQFSISPI